VRDIRPQTKTPRNGVSSIFWGLVLSEVQAYHFAGIESFARISGSMDFIFLGWTAVSLRGRSTRRRKFGSFDFRATFPPFTPEVRKANLGCSICSEKSRDERTPTPAQIAPACLLTQKPWIVPIPGTTKLHRLEENIGAVLVELTLDDLRDIDSAASKITVQGARYPEKLEKMTGL
jgi:hypothetical protein